MSQLLHGSSVGYVVVDAGERLSSLIELLHGYSAEHAAVVDDNGVLVGVVSSRDVARVVVEAFESQALVEHRRLDGVLSLSVSEVMSTPPLTCRPGTGLGDALRVMAERGIGFLPVVDERGVLLDAYTELHAALALIGDGRPASCCATLRVFMADPDTPLIEALGVMSDYGFRRLPYQADGTVWVAVLNDVVYAVVRRGTVTGSLRGVGRRAVLVPTTTPLGSVAELVLALPERAVLLGTPGGGVAGIITERDLLYAATGARGREQRGL